MGEGGGRLVMAWKKFGHQEQLGVRCGDGAFGWRFSGVRVPRSNEQHFYLK